MFHRIRGEVWPCDDWQLPQFVSSMLHVIVAGFVAHKSLYTLKYNTLDTKYIPLA